MKKVKTLLLIMAFIFSLVLLTSCKETENDNTGNTENQGGSSTVDTSGVTLESTTKEYTGDTMALAVNIIPEGAYITYTYTTEAGEVVKEMVEIGTYNVKAEIKDKKTEEVLKTLNATLTIKPVEAYDEVPEDENSKLELMFGTEIYELLPDPEDSTRLIAGGIELWASESIYLRHASFEMPLQFLGLATESVNSKIVDNTVFVSKPGTYDFVISFPEDELIPFVLVREGSSNKELYFRTSDNEFAMDKEEGTNLFTVSEDEKTATFEATLEAGAVFKISNYYSSKIYKFDPCFAGRPGFGPASSDNSSVIDCVKVIEAGTYLFKIDLTNSNSETALKVYKDGSEVYVDNEILYFRSSINDNGLTHPLVKDGNISYIEVELEPGHLFKIANKEWSTQYNFGCYKSEGNNSLTNGGEFGDFSVVIPGLYRFEINEKYELTIKRDGTVVGKANLPTVYQLVVKNSSGETTKYTLNYEGPWEFNPEFIQYSFKGLNLKKDDIITLYNASADEGWVLTKIDEASAKDGNGKPIFTVVANVGIKVSTDGRYDVYLKMKFQEDNIYFGKA